MRTTKHFLLILALGTVQVFENVPHRLLAEEPDVRITILNADRKELQELHDKHWEKSHTAYDERQFTVAVRDAHICLVIDLKLYEEPHEALGDSFEWYATMCDLTMEAPSVGKEAETAWLRAIDNRERLYGADNWRVINAKVGLDRSRVLWGLTEVQLFKLSNATKKERIAMECFVKGKFDDAIKMQTFVVQERSKLLGEASTDAAYSISGLAEIYEEKMDYAQAEIHYLQASNILKQTLREDHPIYAQSLEVLAKLYQKMGDNQRAEPLLQQAMEIKANAAMPNEAVKPEK